MRPAAVSAEFLGSAVLSFTVGCNVLSSPSFSWETSSREIASIAAALLAMTSAFGPISGGHFNPSVSVAMLCAGKMQVLDTLVYVLVQVAGSTAAMLFISNLFQPSVVPIVGRDIAVEMIYAFMLNFVTLCVSGKRNNPENEPNQFYGIASSTILAAGLASTRLKSGVFNPGITIGLGINQMGFEVPNNAVFVLVQLVAGVLAAALFRLLRPEEKLSNEQLPTYVPSLAVRLCSECLGTTFLMLTLGLSSSENVWAAPCALVGLVYALGDLSGGHFNPAVTAAVVLSRTRLLISSDLLGYWFAQVTGCLIAAVMCLYLITDFQWDLGPKAPFQAGGAYIMEFTFSIVLCLTVLAVSCIKGITSIYSRNFYFGLAIGLALLTGSLCSAKVSGACMNPAVSLAVAISSLMEGRTSVAFYASNYCVAELFAGVTAAMLFRSTHAREYVTKDSSRMPLGPLAA
eukprot:symbB.v1.2.009093.t2/scaffold573.1/size222803/2